MTTYSFYPILALVIGMVAVSSCTYDNFEGPNSKLTGRIVYNGTPLGLSAGEVPIQLWQPGYALVGNIGVNVAQDGSYSSLLFDGFYKMVIPKGQGPFLTKTNAETKSDTIPVNVKGNTSLDIEVIPYYMVRNERFSSFNKKITATLKLEKIITDTQAKDIEKVALFVSKTTLINQVTNASNVSVELEGSAIKDLNAVTLSIDAPVFVPSQNYGYARIGVKIKDIEDWLFSPVQRVNF